MCGIAGKIFFDQNRTVSLNELKKMSDVIKHRGPDDEGHYNNSNVGLAFRRLSIIDLHTGHQPLSNFDGSLWITFNGEVYNFKESRLALEKKGYKFRTNTDTEVIVNLYEEYGENCVDHLRGMFAFVIWDDRKKQLFGARDRFGIKPFHYYIDNEKFLWGSEIKSIVAAENVKSSLRLESLDHYFAYGYTPRNQSIYNEIQKLEPGSSFTLRPYEKEKLIIKKYWEISYTPDYTKSEAYWKEALYEELNKAVKMRMISDVPLGAFLSGGVDSSIVVSMMALNSKDPIKTFSIGFKEEKYNELKYAQLVADRYKTDHHEFIIEPESVELLPDLVRAYDEPFADSSAIPTYYVSKYTREHVTVALSGDGGDELFAGYVEYDKMIMLHKKKHYPKAFFNMVNKLIPDHMFGKGMAYYLSKDKNNIAAYFNLWKDYERENLFRADIKNKLEKNYSEGLKIDIINSSKADFLTKMQQLDMKTYMVDDILTKVDRASMMNSLEARVPLLDHKFAELSFKIPSELKLKGGIKKHILKETFSKILPPGIISHKKQGFAIPLNNWFKDSLKDYAFDELTNSKYLYNYLEKPMVNKILNNHQKGKRDYSAKIWNLLFLNEWLKQNKI
ncbi:asparagine synthase (glutamine-hydrolyzing) [Aureibaculum sp. A20]|uniref:asparagine synthase (glutamine-hydrolyzing) n=1 Tax=Aureibaculum flavum TaxID=2795986 RepID=A0ABS0WKW1_9FLAO|nr:asparagine synthase (glutamine-hydrolyzing) [Aureibaculum flavum]MBJ2172612.1 asparagine synthase (glutamine-hydrolyzing) [Aureibaculum flavum]